jgi:hypothetical protein
MRVLDELEREIERIALEADTAPKRRRWWRSSPLLLMLPLGLATVAVAATTGILAGDPVKEPEGVNRNPRSGVGVSVDRGRLLDVRAPDPDGGPPWALRLVKTSRGLGCVQLGRTVDGKLGVLGRDGAFNNDGRLHELSPTIVNTLGCQQPDRAGNFFTAMTFYDLPASGDASCRYRSQSARGRPDCAPGSLRTIYYGLLGPEAAAVTYIDDQGRTVRQPVSSPQGAYLIVHRTVPDRRNASGFSPGITPTKGVEAIEYRDGSTCKPAQARHTHGSRSCPLKGYQPLDRASIPASALRTPVRVDVSTKPERPAFRGGSASANTPDQRRITIRFRARLAADVTSYYTFSLQPTGGRTCNFRVSGPIARDIVAGTVVTRTVWVPYSCRGTATIRVGYAQADRPSVIPFTGPGQQNAKVGTVTVPLR